MRILFRDLISKWEIENIEIFSRKQVINEFLILRLWAIEKYDALNVKKIINKNKFYIKINIKNLSKVLASRCEFKITEILNKKRIINECSILYLQNGER